MTPGDAALPDDLDTAHRQIREQAEALRRQGLLIARLQHQLEQLLRHRFGKKGEKVDPDQLLLFAQDVIARAEPMAPVITSKLADHLPLYRQGAIFRRHGVWLARSTMCGWMAACAGLLEPVVKAMIRRVLSSKVIGTDDTPVTVQDRGGKGSKTGR